MKMTEKRQALEVFSRFFNDSLRKHFCQKSEYLSLFSTWKTTPEHWFRVEILYALSYSPDFEIKSTNQKYEGIDGQPDFVIKHKSAELICELKVLPKDKNYASALQRFQAGKNNKNDFQMLKSKRRDGIIYVYWPDPGDWKKCKARLETEYGIPCSDQFKIPIESGEVIFSLWCILG